MNALRILNLLHAQKLRRLASVLCSVGYLLKGFGLVHVRYYDSFRAYGFRVNGKMYLGLGPGWAYSYPYLYQLLIDSFCRQYVPRTGDCVVDIGAGLGEESTIFAQLVGKHGTVYSIEANPVVFNGLDFSRRENAFSWMKVFNLAIYHTDGEVQIEDNEESYLSNTINIGTTNVKPVQASTFDSFVRANNISTIDFLKVNIEGAEQYLIMGMDQSIAQVRNVCVSCHDFRHIGHNHGEFYMTLEKVREYLTKNNFETMMANTGNTMLDNLVFARNRRFPA